MGVFVERGGRMGVLAEQVGRTAHEAARIGAFVDGVGGMACWWGGSGAPRTRMHC
jgi:hypothetical protein